MAPSRPFSSSSAPPTFGASPPGASAIPSCSTKKAGSSTTSWLRAPPPRTGRSRLVVNASRKSVDFAVLRQHLPAGVRLTELPEAALIALQGPLAAATLARLAPGQGLESMPFMSARSTRLAGFETFVSRSGYTGEDGYEISLASSEAESFARLLLSQPDVAPIGLGARDSLRLEAGLSLYGHELDETVDPIEAALTWSIQKRRRAEGGFPGAKRIQDALANGPARLRVGIRPDGRAPAREGAEIVSADGAPIGVVTSGGFGPSVGAPIAMGYVTRAHAAVGTAGQSHGARQAIERACRRVAFSSPRLLPRISQGDTEWRRFSTPRTTNTCASRTGKASLASASTRKRNSATSSLPKRRRSAKKLKQGDPAAVVESVKAASDVFAPASGEVVAVNSEVELTPGLINEDAMGKGWLFRLKLADPGELSGLMDEAAYGEFVKSLG